VSDLEWHRRLIEADPDRPKVVVHRQIVLILAMTHWEAVPRVRQWMEQFRLGLHSVHETLGYLGTILQLEDK
jgi:hypothetical protein